MTHRSTGIPNLVGCTSGTNAPGNKSLFCYLIRHLFTFCSVEGSAKKVDYSGVLKVRWQNKTYFGYRGEVAAIAKILRVPISWLFEMQ